MAKKFFLICSIFVNTSFASLGCRRIVAFKSAPAKKVDLLDARMIPLIASLSAVTCAASAVMSSLHCVHMVLTAELGSSNVMVAMPLSSWY